MKRIEELTNYIYPHKIIADIGCDHGYLIKFAFDKGLIDKAYAIDNKEKPLNNAKKNLKGYENIDYFLSDGLDYLPTDCSLIVLAGMGGNLITNILKKGLALHPHIERIIIEANRNQEMVRKFAVENGLKVISEAIIEEDNIFYEIIVLEKGYITYNDKELMFGPILLKEKSPIFINKWTKKLQTYLNKNTKTLEKEIKLIKEVINYED